MSIISRLLNSFRQFADRAAVSEENKTLSYKSLHYQSLKIASYIVEQNIENSCIAIEVADTVDHIVAITGIILSGNYYVSVTPENKPFFTAENELPVKLIINAALLKAIYLHELKPDFKIEEDINPQNKLCAFFTSGSSGKSKIVIHNHETIYTETLQEIEENEITCKDKLDFVFSVSFSASISCIYPALLSGAELCVYNLKEKGLHQLAEFWERNKITITTLSVSAFQGVCKVTASFQHLTSLRFVSISAEPVKDTTLAYFHEKFPMSTVLQIAYATTETRTIADIKLFNNGTITSYPNSIGKSCRGKRVIIVNENGINQAAGTVGEIVVESRFITDAYYGQPEESAHSFSRKGDIIQYRTGDLGYLNEDGYLFYAGRKKNEIKINGVKISTANIEDEIEKVPGILQAVTVVNNSNATRPMLVCFFKTNNVELSAHEIKQNIIAKLPANHLPQFYIKLDNLPVTHSGKIDRKKLEGIEIGGLIANPSLHEQDESLTDNYQQVIIDVFKKVLETNNVNSNSDFFDLGGDSFTGLLCVAEIEDRLKLTFQSFALLSNSTPTKLGLYLTQLHDKQSLVEIVELNSYSIDKSNLYILNYTFNKKYNTFINSSLSDNFNLICLFYNLRSNNKSSKTGQLIMDQLTAIIGKNEDAIVMGHSFDGYVAHQLACILQQISCCILIDTYNYFEFEKYNNKRDDKVYFKNLLHQVIKNRDFMLPVYLAKKKYNKKLNKKVKGDVNDPVFEAMEQFARDINHKQAINNCIYFQANRSYIRNKDHGLSWKPYIKGNFHFMNLLGNHNTIMQKHTSTIANQINSIVFSEKILINQAD